MGAERIIYKAQMLCPKHSIEITTYKFVQELPRQPFTDGELEFLMQHGYDLIDLVDANDERSPHFNLPAIEAAAEVEDHAVNRETTEH